LKKGRKDWGITLESIGPISCLLTKVGNSRSRQRGTNVHEQKEKRERLDLVNHGQWGEGRNVHGRLPKDFTSERKKRAHYLYQGNAEEWILRAP